jgi:DNA-binding transcriptional ArsR family regulator
MNDELESLLVSGKEVDRKLVTEILSPYLRIDKETSDIRPLSSWDNLQAYKKILIYLVARKAMIALGLNLHEENASATEIMHGTGLKQGTVNPTLRRLSDDGIVSQTKDRKYYIPNFTVERVKTIVREVNKYNE